MIYPQRYSPIGLDIGAGHACAAQLAGGTRSAVAHRLADFPLVVDSSGAGEGLERLTELLDRRGFMGRRVVLAAPRSTVRTSVVSVPVGAAEGAIDAIARSDLSRSHRLDPGAFELACWTLPGTAGAGSGTTSVLACGCPHSALERTVASFEEVGLDVVAIDLHAQAIARACLPLLRASHGALRVVVDLGWESTSLIVMMDSTVLYERTLAECGLSALRDEIKEAMRLDTHTGDHVLFQRGLVGFANETRGRALRVRSILDDFVGAVGGELAMSMDYAARRHGVDDAAEALLVGAGANIPGIVDRLGESCQVNARVIRPAELVRSEEHHWRADDPALVMALGLASRGSGAK